MLKKFIFSLSENAKQLQALRVIFLPFPFVECVLFTSGRRSPEMQDEIPPPWSKLPRIIIIASEKEKKSITYSWNHMDSHALNSVVRDWSKVPTNQNQFVLVGSRWQNRVLKRACTSYVPVWTNSRHTTVWTNSPHTTLNSVLPLELSMISKSFWRHSWSWSWSW